MDKQPRSMSRVTNSMHACFSPNLSWGWNWTLENQPPAHLGNGIPKIRVVGLLQDNEVGAESLKRDHPAILLGCDMPMHMTSEYLRTTYPNKSVPLDINGSNPEIVELGVFIDALTTTTAPPGPNVGVARPTTSNVGVALRKKYMRNLHMPHWFPDDMKAMNTCPEIFGKNLLEDEIRTPFCPPAWRRWSELFVSGNECDGFPVLHVDVCCVHAVSMQIQGTKRFTIFAPSDTSNIYAMAPSFTSSALPTDLDTVDLAEFPLFANATPIYVELHAGETLYVPAGWWHTAKAVSTEISVTIAASLVAEDNIERFLDSHSDFLAAQSLIKHGAISLQ